MPSISPFPREFVCEHTPTKSRVYAILASPDRPDTLKAVLTCTDPLLAQRAANVLTCLALTGGGAMIDTDADKIHAGLPSAPAASFREASQRLRDRAWPPADVNTGEWEQVQVLNEQGLDSADQDEETRTPVNARLGQLTGKVFRITQLTEYHVFDTDRLMQAAAANNWTLLSDSDETDFDGNLLHALMHLAAIDCEVPGADLISRSARGERLTIEAGDELADWQQKPITATFASGRRQRGGLSGDPSTSRPDNGPARPDFAVLFPVRSCAQQHADEDEEMNCEICADWQITPRTADMLHMSLEVLSDEAFDDVDEHGGTPVTRKNADDWSVFYRLPPITWQADADWRRQFARACEDLADDMSAGRWPTPRSTAEEMALHLAIEDAPTCLELEDDSDDDGHEALPKHPDDYTWDDCSEYLFQDHDVLMLFDEDLTGIADPASAANQFGGVANLQPSSWFAFFAGEEPRDANRGFRR